MTEMFLDGGWLLAVAQIIAIDILLGGDNAVVIALACRKLPEDLRNKGIFWGVVGAIALRIVLIFFALQLLSLPYLKIVGAALLLWIGVKLLQPEEGDAHGDVRASDSLLGAIRTVIVADAVMSIDNVLAVAAAARGEIGLVVFGILVSVPIIVWGSRFVMLLMDRFPAFIVVGGGLLGWIAGEMFISDTAFSGIFAAGVPATAKYGAAVVGALGVLVIGRLLADRPDAEEAEPALSVQGSERES
ncbi:TerC family protein [Azoarcus sp. KH32C]|uniref:TerC family protein n=1 Tax=Azoarcus sp. KH32C TaxID=748247 RepID=UPI0002385BE8|nr:TerC family protein [Azoarcus sp. KH32C]BAL27355.1 integral membrane protein, TerC family [Azoarcus sp. KH32C]